MVGQINLKSKSKVVSIPAVLVPWESGYPVICKITYSGSIPLGTSIDLKIIDSIIYPWM